MYMGMGLWILGMGLWVLGMGLWVLDNSDCFIHLDSFKMFNAYMFM